MTIRDYIVAYNETFRYVEERYGEEPLKSLFATLSDRWCAHLEDCVKRKGIEGCMEYWGGSSGTLGREKATCTIGMENGIFTIEMRECPSIAELRERGREPYAGRLAYCDHCEALYAPVLARYGLAFTVDIAYGKDGSCAGACTTVVKAME